MGNGYEWKSSKLKIKVKPKISDFDDIAKFLISTYRVFRTKKS